MDYLYLRAFRYFCNFVDEFSTIHVERLGRFHSNMFVLLGVSVVIMAYPSSAESNTQLFLLSNEMEHIAKILACFFIFSFTSLYLVGIPRLL